MERQFITHKFCFLQNLFRLFYCYCHRHCGLDPQSPDICDELWGFHIKCRMTVFKVE